MRPLHIGVRAALASIGLLQPMPLLAQELPAASPASGFDNMRLYLELVVNDQRTGIVSAVDYRGGNYYVSSQDLGAAHIDANRWQNAPRDAERKIAVDAIPGVETLYNQETQWLQIRVPPAWLPEQTVAGGDDRTRVPAVSSFGALFNYDIYANKPRQGNGQLSSWGELRLFGQFGVISTSGVYRHAFSGSNDQREGYLRYDTYWRYSDEDRMLTYEAGDIITRTLPWGSTARIGGIQLSRNFSVRPDVVTYPLPRFASEAAVPSAVDLFIDSYRVQSSQIDPGPFILSNTPFINGAGEAVIVTTDALGRTVSTSIPFYVTSALLRPRLSDYSLAFGAMRRRYGERNFDYGQWAANLSHRYGLNHFLTLESHLEATRSLRLGGLGAVMQMSRFGVLNAAYSHSHTDDGNGSQIAAGYQYVANQYSLSAQHIRRSGDYRDLSSIDTEYRPSRRSTQLTASMPLAQWGNLSGGYFDIESPDGTHTRLFNVGWNRAFGALGMLFLSASKASSQNRWSGMMQWVLPLGMGADTLAASVERNADRGTAQRVDYTHSVPSAGGLGWRLGYQRRSDSDDYQQGDLTWRNSAMEVRGGVYGTTGDRNQWASANGSLVWMDKTVFVANAIRDAFVVVSTDGVPDVPVRYENVVIGRTGRHGNLLVPWSVAYYPGKYEIDPLTLPLNMQAQVLEQRIAVKAGGGYLAHFPVRRVLAASVTLVDAQRQPLPVSARASLGNGQSSYVGWDGLAYFEEVADHNDVTVDLPGGQRCHTQFDLDIDTMDDRIAQVGPLACTGEPSP